DLVGSDDRDCQLHQCLAVCNRSDRRRSRRRHDPQSNEIACGGWHRSGAARHGPRGMISPKGIVLDEVGSTTLITTTFIISPSNWAMIRTRISFPPTLV